MKKIAIYGAGGFGREMAVMIRQINLKNPDWELIGFFDDGLESSSVVDGLKILGGIEQLNYWQDPLALCMAIADPRARYQLVEKVKNLHVSFPILIHPNCLTGSDQNSFGKGCILTAGVILTTGIQVGDFGIVNLSSTVGHDVTLGSFATVMPGCSISGNVSIGSRTVMGTGSRILQGLTIGQDCMIGAGSVVTKSFGSNLKLLGVPARKRSAHVDRL